MKKSYVFNMLDHLLSNEINPDKLHPGAIDDRKRQVFMNWIEEEKTKIKRTLTASVFDINDLHEEKAIVAKYHDAIVLLINRSYKNAQHRLAKETGSATVNKRLLDALTDILTFLRKQFKDRLGDDLRLHIIELLDLKKAILKNMAPLDEKLASSGNNIELRGLLTHFFTRLVERIDNEERITLHEANYVRRILKDTAEKYETGLTSSDFPSLHELFVYWNLNTTDTIRYFTLDLEERLNQHTDLKARLEEARLQLNYILKMPEIAGIIYDPGFPGIKDHFAKYLTNEIDYLETKTTGFASFISDSTEKPKRDPFKILCNLSIDQISLILRAAERKEIIQTTSWTALIKALAPYLSTKNQENISPNSLRGKVYGAESRDVQISIQAVEEIKAGILDYQL